MCGIVGMISSAANGFTMQHEKAFTQLLFMDVVRGEDSTGVYGVNKYGNVNFLKSNTPSPVFMEHHEFKSFKSKILTDFRMVCGHNRKATKGWATEENAHPFVEGNKILVHNGTLLTYNALTTKDVKVDSHAILHSLNEQGTDNTIKEINGAFALSWYDAEAKEMNLIRNKERPLFIINTPGAWFYGSELKMLEWILDRNNITIADTTECVPGTLYTFKVDDQSHMYMRPLELYEQKKITYTKEKPTEKKNNTATTYQEKDFVIGTKLVFVGEQLHTCKPNSNGQTKMWVGHWFFDESIKIRVWTSDEELKALEVADPGQGSTKLPNYICQVHLNMVMSKGAKITLLCVKPTELNLETDILNHNIYPDELMLTSQRCNECRIKVEPTDLTTGVFNFTNKETHYICCNNCYGTNANWPYY